ncbi:MAG: hypothetical protein ACOH2A_11160 [Sphingobacteriaceae bacterium]
MLRPSPHVDNAPSPKLARHGKLAQNKILSYRLESIATYCDHLTFENSYSIKIIGKTNFHSFAHADRFHQEISIFVNNVKNMHLILNGLRSAQEE